MFNVKTKKDQKDVLEDSDKIVSESGLECFPKTKIHHRNRSTSLQLDINEYNQSEMGMKNKAKSEPNLHKDLNLNEEVQYLYCSQGNVKIMVEKLEDNNIPILGMNSCQLKQSDSSEKFKNEHHPEESSCQIINEPLLKYYFNFKLAGINMSNNDYQKNNGTLAIHKEVTPFSDKSFTRSGESTIDDPVEINNDLHRNTIETINKRKVNKDYDNENEKIKLVKRKKMEKQIKDIFNENVKNEKLQVYQSEREKNVNIKMKIMKMNISLDNQTDDRENKWNSQHTILKLRDVYCLSKSRMREILCKDLSFRNHLNVYVTYMNFKNLFPIGTNMSSLLCEVLVLYVMSSSKLDHINLPKEIDQKTLRVRKQKLVLKLIPKNISRRVRPSRLDLLVLMRRERHFYFKMWPNIESILKIEYNYDCPWYTVPKCYKHIPKNCVLLEDLLYDGFCHCSDDEFDLDHMRVSLISLARFHAGSILALSNQSNKNLENIFSSLVDYQLDPNNIYVYHYIRGLQYLRLAIFDNKYLRTIEENLNILMHTVVDYISKIKNSKFGILKVLIHGDLTKKNILFRYEDNLQLNSKTPLMAKFIDFQWCQIGSPAIDLLELIFSSAPCQYPFDYFKYYIDIYHTEVINILSQFNYDITKFSREDLNLDLKLMYPYGAIIGLTTRWMRYVKINQEKEFTSLMINRLLRLDNIWIKYLHQNNKQLKFCKDILSSIDFNLPFIF